MKRITLLALATAFVVTQGYAQSSNKPPAKSKSGTAPAAKKIYRWVDENGKVQFSETLPAEAKNSARTEFNAKGRSTGQVDRAMTPEERAAFEREQAEAAKLAEMEAAKRRAELAMMQVFSTEEDLKRSFNERINLTKQSIESTEASIGSQRSSLVSLLADASEDELQNRPSPAKRVATIRELHEAVLKNKQRLIDYRIELGTLNGELESALKRFRELKNPTGADATPASASTSPPAS